MATTRSSSAVDEAYSRAVREGIERSKAVNEYLQALGEHKRRGPKRSPERIRARLAELENEIPSSGLTRIRLMQEEKDLRRELERLERSADLASLEAGFVKHARVLSEKDGIEYGTWLAYGVPREVLIKAGIVPGDRNDGAHIVA